MIIQLTDDVVLLRQPDDNDAVSLFQAVKVSLPELEPWMDWATIAYTMSSAQNWVDFVQTAWLHNTSFHFLITDKKTSEFLGCCGLDGLNHKEKSCSLGYWVRSDKTNMGIAFRSSRLLIQYAFSRLNLEKIEIVIGEDNIASQKVANKLGANLTGYTKKPMVVHDQEKKALIFEINKKE